MDHGQRSGLKGSARATLNLIFLCLVALLGSPAGAQSGTGDRLAPQDTVEIRVSGWSALPGGSAEAPRLTGAFTIGAAGFVELPIIGPVRASGLRADELAKLIADHLQARSDVVEGPVTTIQVKQYPAFAVRGLVERPGKYPYRPNLTVQEAVEAAGGVAQLAQTLSISRSVGREREFTVARNTLVLPGDIISVSQTSAPETLSARTSTNNSSATNTEEREIAMQQSVADSEQKRERSKVDSLQRKYLAARGEVEAVRKEALAARQAARDDAALYSQSLASARQRAASLTQELSAMRADLDAAKAQLALEQNTASRATAQARVVADARALQARALEEQRQRADRLARDLVLAEREVEGLKADAAIAARAKAAALRDRQAAEALANSQNELVERERVKGAALKQEFFAARREIEQLKKSVHPAGDRSGDAVRSELAEAREDLDAMRADLDAAKAQLALEQNTASRATAQARVVADTKVLQARALEEQQKRADRLARDLVLTQREVEGLKTDAAIAARAKAAALRAHQAVEATLADTTRALEEGRQTVKRFGRDLAAASQSIDALEARAKQAAAAAAAALQARQVAEAAAKRA
ncbi:polysaccharide biosynthesis/export family protein, partial [Neomesorhizobium albiziae]